MREKGQHTNLENLWLEGEISSEEFLLKTKGSTETPFQKSLNSISQFSAPAAQTQEDIWKNLEKRIQEEVNIKTIPMYRKYWVGIAASLIFAVGFFFISDQFRTNQITIETSVAEFQSVYLPDSSIVHMNAGSTISFSKRHWQNNRRVELSGEAFFEVKRGNDFVVETSLGNVAVLGTSFNVRVREFLEVACKTGKVRVTSPDGNDYEDITPGLGVLVKENDVLTPIEVNLSEVDTWRKGEFYFESMLFSEVLAELKRQFDIEVEFDTATIEDRPYTTYFNRGDLVGALQLVCKPLGLTFKIDGKKVFIKNNETQIP